MKFVLVIAMLTMALVGTASAEWPYNDNNIGMYFDEGATNYCCGTLPGLLEAYLVLTHSTVPTIGGWEAKITSSGAGAIVGVFPRYQHVNAGTRVAEYVVGFGFPQPTTNGRLVLADVLFNITASDAPTYGYVGPTYFHTLPEALPAVLDGADLANVLPAYPSLGGLDDPIILINNGCVIDNESTSFGAVKSLFR